MPLTNVEYVLFALFTLFMGPALVVVTFFLWMILPFHMLITAFLRRLAPVVRLLGRNPTLDEPGSGPLVGTLFFWPLTLAPIHFLNFRVLEWPGWACILMMLASVFVVATAVLCATGRPRR